MTLPQQEDPMQRGGPSAAGTAQRIAPITIVDYATGVKGTYCLMRVNGKYSEYWNTGGWAGAGYVFKDLVLAESVAQLLNDAAYASAERERCVRAFADDLAEGIRGMANFHGKARIIDWILAQAEDFVECRDAANRSRISGVGNYLPHPSLSNEHSTAAAALRNAAEPPQEEK